MPQINIAVVQQSCSQNAEENRAKTVAYIREAASQGAQLIVLQELHNGMYFCQEESQEHFKLAESIPGPSTEFYGNLAKALNIVLVISLFEKRLEGLYHNTAVVIESDGGIAGLYRKMHIPDDPGYYEKYYFTPGDLGFTPIPTSLGNLGVLICWDQWFPEAARLMALAGADLLIYPTAIGWEPTDTLEEKARQLDSWKIIQRSHAIANHLPVVVANRRGTETSSTSANQAITFWGNSFITGAQGQIIADTEEQTEGVILATINTEETTTQRHTWPFLRDRRIDHYQGLSQLSSKP